MNEPVQFPLHALNQVHLARLVLEVITPLSISTGSPDGVFDSALVRDANDLPAIPASSLAGVLRHLCTQQYGVDMTRQLFGFQDRDRGAVSQLHLGWGLLLDSRGRAADGLLLGESGKRLQEDALFRDALDQIGAPMHRNRVRLSHRGAAVDTGKFDRSVLAAGHRFAVELRLGTEAHDSGEQWNKVLALLSHPGFRLGGGTRAGLGRLRCISICVGHFDLRVPQQARALANLGTDPSDLRNLTVHSIPQSDSSAWIRADLALDARNLWRLGQGDVLMGELDADEKVPDLLPVSERCVSWSNGTGGVSAQRHLLVPASSLKGVLLHRMAFHARRFARVWDPKPPGDKDGHPLLPAEVLALAGNVKDKQGGIDEKSPQGWAGCLYIDDIYLPAPKTVRLMHNSIDRFTGGAREHRLFEEQTILGGKIQVPISIDLQRLKRAAQVQRIDLAAIQRAFLAALQDLCEGRLALGARSTSGHGFFQGEIPATLSKPWTEIISFQQEAR
ncbi:RAMP superfamily CRISPR-associated protein [Ferrovum sp.]|uniref:RAMP superfamily CRISPR-associated protein n=1 Tax=Ferrovum sp. TaxID=2609467 RepID=UPI0026142338|nr:RAMP superfamily CRISPR-associated protein [Ferrovum sp.]